MAFVWKDLMIDVLPEAQWAGGCNLGTCFSPSQVQSDCPQPSCAAPACANASCKASSPVPTPKKAAGDHDGSPLLTADFLALQRQLADLIDHP